MRPHVPPPQPPAVQVPVALGHAAAAAMQVEVTRLQQPPALHRFPSQQGWPGPPQVTQVVLEVRHARFTLVQKLATPELLFGSPLQHASLLSPQLPFKQPPLLHTPSAAFLQLALSATQMECTQHAFVEPAQLLF